MRVGKVGGELGVRKRVVWTVRGQEDAYWAMRVELGRGGASVMCASFVQRGGGAAWHACREACV